MERGEQGVPARYQMEKPTIPMAERIRRAQEAANRGSVQSESLKRPTTFEDMRKQQREQNEANFATFVASEKAKLQAEFSGMSYRDKIGLLNRKERDLVREEDLLNEANRTGGINPANRAVYESYWRPYKTEEAWEQSVKARKQAYKEIDAGLGS